MPTRRRAAHSAGRRHGSTAAAGFAEAEGPFVQRERPAHATRATVASGFAEARAAVYVAHVLGGTVSRSVWSPLARFRLDDSSNIWFAAWARSPAAAWTAAAIYTAALAAVVAHHEMWRDEMQAWLLARDSPSPLGLLHAMRYEGHPPLWHLLLWPLAHLSTNPVWMQVLHVAIAGTTAFLVFRFSPFSWPIRILLLSGYFFSYEWAVLARNYGLVAMFAFGFCVLYARRWQSLPRLGAVLGFMSLSHVSGLLIALALGFTLGTSQASPLGLRWPASESSAQRCRRRRRPTRPADTART
jgi:hypothetical protein